MFGFVEKYNMLNCESLAGNCVRYMHGMFGLAEKLNTQNFICSTENVYIIYVRNVWSCREIECPELPKFNEKLYT